MPFSYDLNTMVGRLRLIIGDTSAGRAKFQDEELAAILVLTHNNLDAAAAQAASILANRFADQVDVAAGDVAVKNSQRSELWARRARDIGPTSAPVIMWAGGISETDKQNRYEDTDRVQPFFTRDTILGGSFPGAPDVEEGD